MQPDTLPAPIVQKTYETAQWLVLKAARFPKTHKFTLGDRIAGRALDLLETLAGAAYARQGRTDLFDRADRQISGLRYLLRMAKDLKLVSIDGYGHGSESLEEIGRMLGGWRKFESGKRP